MSTEVVVSPRRERKEVGESALQPWRRLALWIARNRVDVALVVALGSALAVIHASGMESYPARFDDEGAYTSQAWAVLDRFDLSHYTYWYDHPPLGWLILAVYMGVTGALLRAPFGVAAGREAMLVFHIASVALLYVLARRVGMKRPFAAMAVLLFGLSPLGIFFHRMVLLDNLAMPFLLAGFVLVLSPERRLGAHVLAAASLAIAVLIRETLVLILPFAVWVYWRNTQPENRRYSVVLSGTTFLGLVLLYPLFALLRGELLPGEGHVSLVGTIGWQLFERAGSGFVFDPSSPAGRVLASWVGLDPWILVLGLLAALLALAVPRLRWVGGVVVLLAVMLLRPGYLPVMYVVSALPFIVLAISGVLDEAWRVASQTGRKRGLHVGAWVRRGLVAGAVALLIVMVGPWYRSGVATAMAKDADQPFREAQAWLGANLKPDDIVFVDGALWVDLVRAGHPIENVIWFYKLDSDPGVEVPGGGGWQVVDYVVSSGVMRDSLYELPQLEAALENSEPVVVFGNGPSRVEIRRIEA